MHIRLYLHLHNGGSRCVHNRKSKEESPSTDNNQSCLEIIGRFDIGLETLSGSGADNWGSLDDRMRFIIPFFRSYQREMRLLSPPLSDSQTAPIKAGHFPGGKL